MSGYLDHLLDRATAAVPLARPRVRTFYEPAPRQLDLAAGEPDEADLSGSEPGRRERAPVEGESGKGPGEPGRADGLEGKVVRMSEKIEGDGKAGNEAGAVMGRFRPDPARSFEGEGRPRLDEGAVEWRAGRATEPRGVVDEAELEEEPARSLFGTSWKHHRRGGTNQDPAVEVVRQVLEAGEAGWEGPVQQANSREEPGMMPDSRRAGRGRTSGRPMAGTGGPTVQVHIGRVEVRAVMESAPVGKRGGEKRGPRLSLEAYLKERRGGGR